MRTINLMNLIAAIMLLTTIITMLAMKSEYPCKSNYYVIEDSISTDNKMLLNEKNIVFWCELIGVQHIDIVLAQAKLETGNFTSRKCLKNNNLFGFQRSIAEPLKFNSWIESIIFYKRWQDTYYNMDKYPNYYDFLNDYGYAEDNDYIYKLKQF